MRWTSFSVLALALLAVTSSVYAAEEEEDVFDEAIETDDIVVGDNVNVKSDEKQQVEYQSPYATPGKFYFADHFDSLSEFSKKWIKSQAKKDDAAEEIAKYDGEWELEAPGRPILMNDLGLVLKSKAKHAAIASRLIKPFVFSDKPLVVQYEVQLQDGQECGGSYIKLLSSGKETTDLTKFNDKTPYTIMFGPDKCGNDIKLHFIFRHVNPKNGTITEKHCKKSKERLEEPFKDKQPHLYQLLIRPDNTFEIRVDHRLINEGSLLNNFEPPVNPPKEINDPEDKKPTDWDEREKIADPDAKKPEDWDEDEPPQIPDPSASKPENWLDDEEEMLPDPDAIKPEDWDTEIDGEWEAPLITNPICEKAVGCGLWKAPLITNPNYKGKWRAPLIDNPNYQGKWAPRKIPNPDFFEDTNPFKMTTIAAIGIELWSMSSDILFDNLLITDDIEAANEWAAQTFDLKKKQIDKEAETLVSRLINYTNENPWMWGVYVVVVGLPLSIAIFFLCSSKEKPSEVHPKKTDAYLPDDEVPSGSSKGGQKKSKSDLESKPIVEDQEGEEEDDAENEEEEVVEEEIGGEDESPIEEVQGDIEEDVEPVKNSAPRKRKPRKE